MLILLPYGSNTIIFSIFFVLFCVRTLCCSGSRYHSLNWKDISVTNVDIFEKKQLSLQFLYSLVQVFIVYRVSFIFHRNAFLVSVCTRGFTYLLCWPRGRGRRLVCTRRFSFHELYNFLLLLPTTFTHTHTHTHDPRSLPTTYDPRHLGTPN